MYSDWLEVVDIEPRTQLRAACGREFAWRRKWARCWGQVRYCSKHYRVVSSEGAGFASLVSYAVPVVALVAGAAVLGARLDASVLAALTLILFGVAVTRAKAPSAPRSEDFARAGASHTG